MAKEHSCCGDGGGSNHGKTMVGTLTRPRYSPGLILEDSDLTAAVDYTRHLNQLLFSSLFGCGVICGLTIKVDGKCGLRITVDPGLALDGCGNPLHLTQAAIFEFDKRFGTPTTEEELRSGPKQKDFWIVACAGEKLCEPRALVCDEDSLDGSTQATRFRSTVDVRLSCEPPECFCGCGVAGGKWPSKDSDLNDLAWKMLGDKTCDDPGLYPCHKADEQRVACADDCGCGSACACGCCVLLGWVHWLGAGKTKDGEVTARWVVLHDGVRRFIRPKLLPDPMCKTDIAQIKPPAQEGAQAPKEVPSNLQRIRAIEQILGAQREERSATIDERITALEGAHVAERLKTVEGLTEPAMRIPKIEEDVKSLREKKADTATVNERLTTLGAGAKDLEKRLATVEKVGVEARLKTVEDTVKRLKPPTG